MLSEPEPELAPEIAHVLLMDVVGYSKLLVDEQIALLRTLNHIVRGTEHFIAAESSGRLKRLPTGDGMALLFYDSPETPVRCALEISQQARARVEVQLRMGVHSGPIKEVLDVNDRANVAGAGIDIAQRVLDCGDAGHILLSQRVAEDLKPYRHWNSCLRDLGECEVKHGLRLRIFNVCKDGLGNPAIPEKIRQQRGRIFRGRDFFAQWSGHSRRRKAALWLGCCLAVVLLGFGGWAATKAIFRLTSADRPRDWPASIPAKSVAVLPFSNLSDDNQNAFFTQGVQDEILTNLSRIADLKVISRTSVLPYASSKSRNVRDIARSLGVQHVLEGSVQRIGDRVRITAQLIDARTDAHIWADHYDRELTDVFAIQTEVAEEVAEQLKARLSPQEKAAIEERPTGNIEAYSLYLQGKALAGATTFNARGGENLIAAARLFEQAIGKDPNFFLAYYQLARAHDQTYMLGADHSPNRLALADAAIKAAVRLRPDAGETHLALGEHLYWGYRDYERARAEFALARQALPNDPRPLLMVAYIDRRQGRSEDALRGLKQALELDPRDLNILQQISLSYELMRRFADAGVMMDRVRAVAPDDIVTRVQQAALELEWHANTRPLRRAVDAILQSDPAAGSSIADLWLYLALCERDAAAATRALAVLPAEGCYTEGVLYPRAWCVGVANRTRGDAAAARDAFTAARNEAERTVREQPAYAEALSALAMIDAALGRKEEAIDEATRAVALLPISEDAVEGAILLTNLAIVYAWTGEQELALEQIRHAFEAPGQLSYGQLRLHPYWDPLRGDRRFEEFVASLAPK